MRKGLTAGRLGRTAEGPQGCSWASGVAWRAGLQEPSPAWQSKQDEVGGCSLLCRRGVSTRRPGWAAGELCDWELGAPLCPLDWGPAPLAPSGGCPGISGFIPASPQHRPDCSDGHCQSHQNSQRQEKGDPGSARFRKGPALCWHVQMANTYTGPGVELMA